MLHRLGRRWWVGVLLVAALAGSAAAAAGFGGSAVAALPTLPTLPAPARVLVQAQARLHQDHIPPPLPLGLRRTVVHWVEDGLPREYVEVAPRPDVGPLPLLVVLHGRRQTAWRAERMEGWDAVARTANVAVAYGAGYGGSWNGGTCCGAAARAHVDDVGYVLQVVRRAEARLPIDRHRVYLVGFSNGGMLAYRVACAHTRVLSAVAVVAGSLQLPACRPQRSLDLLAVAGGRDRIVPFDGTAYSRVAGGPTTSVLASLAPWYEADARTPAVVRLVRLPRLGHDWPTVRNSGYAGTEQIWRFLDDHPRLSL